MKIALLQIGNFSLSLQLARPLLKNVLISPEALIRGFTVYTSFIREEIGL